MFTPIRNLITYIQKNASGSTFFGGTSSNSELNEDITMENQIEEPTASTLLPNTETTETFSKTVETTTELTQTKTIITEKSPTTIIDSTAAAVISPAFEKKQQQDNNENIVFEKTPTTESDSNTNTLPLFKKDEEENTYKTCEEEKDVFINFPPEVENEVDFHVGEEIIVLNDPDLNVSMSSEPATDPLAIDDYNPNSVVNSPNPLDSSTDGDVLYVNIEGIQNKTSKLISEIEVEETTTKTTDEQEIRSDGSDSGLGSETSTLQTTLTSTADTSTSSVASSSPKRDKIPLRSNLKRRTVDAEENQQQQKKLRRSINFDGVKVYYFPRIQGHGCVPSQGGCTLGMGAHHLSFKTFSLAEHAAEIRRAHKLQLQEINPRGSSSEESDSDEELSEGSGSDLDAETNGFLQPVSPKQRRALLKAAGVRKIDPNEKIECKDIRNSREVCGCVCRDFCDPDTCACSQAGIKCQVDRAMFPCGCSRDACGNVIGRIEFNPARVRTHYIHTMMRLEMENRPQKRSDELPSTLTAPNHMVYNNVPTMANSSTAITNYNTLSGYGIEQTTNAYHHMQQPHNPYMNHITSTHSANSVYSNLSSPIGIGTTTETLPLQQSHNHFVNTESSCINNPNLAINGGNLLYQDRSIYPTVQSTPPATVYGDILAPFATSIPYHSAQVAESSYASGVYSGYQNHPHQQHFLGYTTGCSEDLADFTDSHNSFICLNTPEASSSRLSVINDLLHNNRNTTAALVAVSPSSSNSASLEMTQDDNSESSKELCVTHVENSNLLKDDNMAQDDNTNFSKESDATKMEQDSNLSKDPEVIKMTKDANTQLSKEPDESETPQDDNLNPSNGFDSTGKEKLSEQLPNPIEDCQKIEVDTGEIEVKQIEEIITTRPETPPDDDIAVHANEVTDIIKDLPEKQISHDKKPSSPESLPKESESKCIDAQTELFSSSSSKSLNNNLTVDDHPRSSTTDVESEESITDKSPRIVETVSA